MKLINKLLPYKDLLNNGARADVVGFTGNKQVKSNGELVMGAGAAKAFKEACEGWVSWEGESVASFLGEKVSNGKSEEFVYCTLFGEGDSEGYKKKVYTFVFFTKDHWKDKSDIQLLEQSVDLLTWNASRNPQRTFHLNYPAIGHGGLSIDEVEPIVETLPDNVWLYKGDV